MRFKKRDLEANDDQILGIPQHAKVKKVTT